GLGVVDAPATDETIRVIHSLYETFSRIFQWILAPLAIGLFCLMAGVAATVETDMFLSLIGFIVAFYGAGIALFIIYTLLLIGFRRVKGIGALASLRQPLGISFLANNPFIAVRPAIDRLVNHLDVEEDVANAVVPFGVIAGQHGQIINIILLTMFLANIYGVDLSAVQIATLFIGGVIGGAAAVGGGAALAPVLIPILASVGVPGDLGIVVLVTTEQIVGPMISFLTVYTASTLVLLGRGKTILATAAAIEKAVEDER
ncbi:MAG: dicarboxylate/amino acid:cation symporter, partial [Hyphomicrobiales bacterium]|nr:dicarboxylate/amino acid:cation symporter [Hyphomicrobiales bacterium]